MLSSSKKKKFLDLVEWEEWETFWSLIYLGMQCQCFIQLLAYCQQAASLFILFYFVLLGGMIYIEVFEDMYMRSPMDQWYYIYALKSAKFEYVN